MALRFGSRGIVGVILFVAVGVNDLAGLFGRANLLDKMLTHAFGLTVTPLFNAVLMVAGLVLILLELRRHRAAPSLTPSKIVTSPDLTPPADSGPTDDDLKALQILGSELKSFRMHELAGALSVTTQQAMVRVDRLLASGHVHRGLFDPLQGNHGYALTPKGRETLVKRGLL